MALKNPPHPGCFVLRQCIEPLGLTITDAAALGVTRTTMREHPLGREAQMIDEVVSSHPGRVLAKTGIGGTRLLDVMFGEQLPRIC
jgi:hydrogenase maturation factor